MGAFKLFIKGGLIGIANIIPGVSGGTMAVILGIYDALIEHINTIIRKPAKCLPSFLYVTLILSGALASILLLANFFDYLLSKHFQLTMLFFVGLIIGSIPSVIQGYKKARLNLPGTVSLIAGISLVLAFGGTSTALPVTDPGIQTGNLSAKYLTIAFAGFLAGGAMIIPGVSGSLILLIMGQYHVIIQAIKHQDINIILLCGAGAVAGILLFAQIMAVLLRRHPDNTHLFILGLVGASALQIYDGLPLLPIPKITGLTLLALGVLISFSLSGKNTAR